MTNPFLQQDVRHRPEEGRGASSVGSSSRRQKSQKGVHDSREEEKTSGKFFHDQLCLPLSLSLPVTTEPHEYWEIDKILSNPTTHPNLSGWSNYPNKKSKSIQSLAVDFLIYILTNVFQQCSAASEEKGNRRVEEGAGDEGRWEEEGERLKNPQMNIRWDFDHLNMIVPKIWSQVIDERCGKPKSLDGASEGLIIDHQMNSSSVLMIFL